MIKKSYPLGTYMIERKDGTLTTATIKNQQQAQFFHNHLERFQIKLIQYYSINNMTYIYKQISKSEFIDEMTQTYDNRNFTYDAKVALYEYLSNYTEDTGKPMELDTIALCCEYTEYENFKELQAQYPNIKDLEELSNYTTVIPIDNTMKTDSFIIQDF